MTSLVARASAFGTRLFRVGSPYVSGEALARHIKHNRVGPMRPPRAMQRRFHVTSRLYRGREVFTIGPKPISEPGRRRNDHPSQPGQVLYLHGGAFVEGIFFWHWYFIARMVGRLGMTFTVPLYPSTTARPSARSSATFTASSSPTVPNLG
jgi:epsilon-lactone hydrolase